MEEIFTKNVNMENYRPINSSNLNVRKGLPRNPAQEIHDEVIAKICDSIASKKSDRIRGLSQVKNILLGAINEFHFCKGVLPLLSGEITALDDGKKQYDSEKERGVEDSKTIGARIGKGSIETWDEGKWVKATKITPIYYDGIKKPTSTQNASSMIGKLNKIRGQCHPINGGNNTAPAILH